jgi:hypothetical protein
MRPDARLVLAEAVPRDGTGSLLAKLVDVEMLAIGGRERTQAEYRDLLASAGLRLTQVIDSDGQQSLIEAVPV